MLRLAETARNDPWEATLGRVEDGGTGYLDLPPPPGARTWSKAMGPPPKKMRAKARAARARGNSYPLLPIKPLWKFTLAMATDRSRQMAKEATRVNRPSRTSRPPRNSVKAER